MLCFKGPHQLDKFRFLVGDIVGRGHPCVRTATMGITALFSQLSVELKTLLRSEAYENKNLLESMLSRRDPV